MLGRSAVSPVIAVLLLVMIAVIAGTLLYVWLSGYMGTLQAGAGTESLEEKIKIEGVKYDSTATKLTAYVRNMGDVSVTITAIYLINATSETVMYSNTNVGDGSGVSINSGAVGSVELTCTLTSDQTYIVKVTTSKGTEATYKFTYEG